MVAPFLAVQQSIVASDVSRDDLTSSFLAQEGIEYVINVRDADYLYNHLNGASRSWLYGLDGTGGSPDCFSSDSDKCTIDPTASVGNQVQSYTTAATLPLIYLSSLFIYNQQSNGTPTLFNRKIQLACTAVGTCVPSTAKEVQVISVVSWTERGTAYKTKVTEYLDNWLP